MAENHKNQNNLTVSLRTKKSKQNPKHFRASSNDLGNNPNINTAFLSRNSISCKVLCVILSLLLVCLLVPTKALHSVSAFASDDTSTEQTDNLQTAISPETNDNETSEVTNNNEQDQTTVVPDQTQDTTDDTQDIQEQQDSSAQEDQTKDEQTEDDQTDVIDNLVTTLGAWFDYDDSDDDSIDINDDEQSDELLGDSNANSDPTIWDFSEYSTTITLNKNSSRSNLTSTSYSNKHSTSVASIKMYGPLCDDNKYKNYVSSSGYSTNYGGISSSSHYGSTYTANGSYLVFTPTVKLKGIEVEYEVKDAGNYKNWLELSTSYEHSSDTTIGTNTTSNRKNGLTATFTPTGGLEANNSYYLYHYETKNDGSIYTDYKNHGMVIKKITAITNGANLSGKLSNCTRDTEVTLTYTPAQGTAITKTVNVEKGEECNYSIEGIPLDVAGTLTVTPKNGFTSTYSIPAPSGDVTQDIDLTDSYARIIGEIFNTNNESKFTVSFGDSDPITLTIPQDEAMEFSIEDIDKDKQDALIISREIEPDVYNSNYLQVTTTEQTTDIGRFSSLGETTECLNITNYQDALDLGITFKLYVYMPVHQSDLKVYHEIDLDSDTVYLPEGTEVKLVASPVNVWYKDDAGSPVGQTFAIPQTLTVQVPTYTWTRDDSTYEWTCKATYPLSNGGTYTSDTLSTEDGSIKRKMTSPSSTSTHGKCNLTTDFDTADLKYFVNQSKNNEDAPFTKDHSHDGITKFDSWNTSNSLPTTGSYYLDTDVTISSTTNISGTLNLCLNGHVIKWTGSTSSVFSVPSGKTLNLYDCKTGDDTCRHYFKAPNPYSTTDPNYEGVFMDKFTLIENNTTSDYYIDGGVITGGKSHVIEVSGTLNTYNVNFAGNSTSGGVKGSVICFDENATNSKATIKGGTFLGNSATGYGGAIYAGGTTNIEGYQNLRGDIVDCKFLYNSAGVNNNEGAGGALCNIAGTTVNISNAVFEHNNSKYCGGAIFFRHATGKIKDVTIKDNRTGVSHNTIQWGGGIGLNTDDANTCTVMTFAGVINISENYNFSNKCKPASSSGDYYPEDNLCIEGFLPSNGSTTLLGAKVNIDKNDPLSPDSLIGVNSYEWNINKNAWYGVITSALSNLEKYEGTSVPRAFGCFFMDNILSPTEYAIAYKDNEAYIVKHSHNLSYSTISDKTLDSSYTAVGNEVQNTIKVECSTSSDQQCALQSDPLYCTLAFPDESYDYDGLPHAANLSNSSAFMSTTSSKYVDYSSTATSLLSRAIVYYVYDEVFGGWMPNNDTRSETEATSVPKTAGKYKAVLKFRGGKYNSSTKSMSYTDVMTIESEPIKIYNTKVDVTINLGNRAFTDESCEAKVGTNASIISTSISGVDSSHQVTVNASGFTCSVKESDKYVGTHDIDEYDETTISLTGQDANEYDIGSVTGTVTIVAADQNPDWIGHIIPDPGEVFDNVLQTCYSGVWYGNNTSGNRAKVTFAPCTDHSQTSAISLGKQLIDASTTDGPHGIFGDPETYENTEYNKFYTNNIESDDCFENFKNYQEYEHRAVGHFMVTYIEAIDLNNDGVADVKEWKDKKAPNNPYVQIIEPGYNTMTTVNLAFADGQSDWGYIKDYNDQDVSSATISNSAEYEYARFGYGREGAADNKLCFHNDLSGKASVFTAEPKTGYEFDYWEVDSVLKNKYPTQPLIKDGKMPKWSQDCKLYKACTEYPSYTFTAHFKQAPAPEVSVDVTSNFDDASSAPKSGDTIEYYIEVTNSGTCNLDNVTVSSPLLSSPITLSSLAAGSSTTIKVDNKYPSYTVTDADVSSGAVSKTVTVNASSGDYEAEEVTVTKNITTQTAKKELTIFSVETTPNNGVKIDDTISYKVVVKNTGTVTLSGIKLYHEFQVLTSEDYGKLIGATLEPGKTITYTSKNVTVEPSIVADDGTLINQFYATGTYNYTSASGGTLTGLTTSSTVSKSSAILSTKVAIPEPSTFTYDAMTHNGIAENSAYTLSGNYSATSAGTHTATLTLNNFYEWDDEEHKGDKSINIDWIINKRTITVPAISESKTYDGTVFKSSNFVSKIIESFPKSLEDTYLESIDEAYLTTKSANAKTYSEVESSTSLGNLKFEFTASEGTTENSIKSNYKFVFTSVELTINKKSINDKNTDGKYDISISATDKTYNSKEQTTTITVKDTRTNYSFLYGAAKKEYTISGDYKATNYKDGGYTATVTVSDDSNYTGTRNVTWLINKAELSITLVGNSDLTAVYNGKEQSVSGWTVSSHTISSEITTYSDDKILPKKDNCIAKGTDASSTAYPMKYNNVVLDSAKFSYEDPNLTTTFNYSNGSLKINQLDITNNPKFVVSVDDLEYNGAEQTTNVSVKYDGSTVAKSQYSISTGTDKGKNVSSSYSVCVNGSGNFKGSKSATWSITKAAITINMSDEQIEAATKEYDGSKLSTSFTTNGKGSDKLTTSIKTNSSNANNYSKVGTKSNNLKAETKGVTGTLIDNYEISYGDNIKASITTKAITVTPEDVTDVVYDGQSHGFVTNKISSDGLISGHKYSSIVWKSGTEGGFDYGESRTNAGITYGKITSLKITSSDGKTDYTNNYTITYGTGKIEISKAKMTIQVLGKVSESEYTYSGEEVSVDSNLLYSASEKTSGTGATNTQQFDASKLTPALSDLSLKGTDAGTYDIKYGDNTLSEDDFEYDDDNFEATIEYTPGKLVINKRTLNVSANASKSTDGSVLSADATITNNVDGETITATVASNGTSAGVYDTYGASGTTFNCSLVFDGESGAKASNYSDVSSCNYSVCLTIGDKMIITITGKQSGTDSENPIYTYDGTSKSITGYSCSCTDSRFDPSKLSLKEGYSASCSAVNVGNHPMGLTKQMFEYTDTSVSYVDINVVDGYLKIKALDLAGYMVQKPSPNEFDYNGQTQAPTYVLKTSEGKTIPSSDYTISFDKTNTINAGDYNTTITGNGNCVGTLTVSNCSNLKWKIKQLNVKFDVKGSTVECDYDGAEHKSIGYSVSGGDAKTKKLIKDNIISVSNISPAKDTLVLKSTNVCDLSKSLDNVLSYEGSDKANIVAEFNIINDITLKINAKSDDDEDIDIKLSPATYVYDKDEVRTPTVIFTDNGKSVGTDQYEITGTTQATDVNTYSINVKSTENSNYDVDKTLTWTITKADLKIKINGNTDEKYYNGEEQSCEGYTYEIVEGATSITPSKINPNGQTCTVTATDVGTAYMTINVSKFTYDDNNYRTTFVEGTKGSLTISQTDIEDKTLVTDDFGNLSFTYANTEYSPTINLINKSTEKDLTLDKDYSLSGTTKATLANQNNTKYTITIQGINGYKGEITVEWVIEKAIVEIQIDGHYDTQTYTGSPITVTGYEATAVKGEDVFDAKFIDKPQSDYVITETNASAEKYVLSLSEDVFSYTDINCDASFVIQNDGYLQIDQKSLAETTNPVVVTMDDSLVYNSQEQTVIPSITYNNMSLIYGSSSDQNDVVVEGDKGTDVSDDYQVTITAIDGGNYKDSTSVDWEITKAELAINVTGTADETTYNGEEQECSDWDATGDKTFFKKSNIEYTGTEEAKKAKGTDADTYYMTLDEDDFDYNDDNVTVTWSITQGQLVINPAEVLITTSASQEYTEGSKLRKDFDETAVEGLVKSEKITGYVETNSDAEGVYTEHGDETTQFSSSILYDSASGAKAQNYSVSYEVSLSILPEDSLTIVITGDTKQQTYNGTLVTATGYSANATFTGFDESYVKYKDGTVTPSVSQTNVAYEDNAKSVVAKTSMGLTVEDFEYTDKQGRDIKFEVTDGYVQIDPKTIVIADKKISAQVTGKNTVYNGSSQSVNAVFTDNEIKLDGVNGKVLSSDDFIYVDNSATDAADNLEASIKGIGNYKGTAKFTDWSIAKKTAKIEISSSQDYTGNKYSYTLTKDTESEQTGFIEGETFDGYVITSKSIPGTYSTKDAEESGYSVYFTSSNSYLLKNYDVTYSISLTISKPTLKVTPTGETFTYDGSNHSLLNSKVSYTGLVSGHDATIKSWENNSKKDAGEYTNVKVSSITVTDQVGTDVTNYYNIEYKSATIKIDKCPVRIKVTASTGSVEYSKDGVTLSGFSSQEIPCQGKDAVTGFYKTTGLTNKKEVKQVVDSAGEWTLKVSDKEFEYTDTNTYAEAIDYEDSKWTVNPTTINSCTLTLDDFAYNAQSHTTTITLCDGTKTLTKDVDYVVDNTSVLTATAAGDYNVKLTGKGNYAGTASQTSTKTKSWNISRASMIINITGADVSKTYTGESISFPAAGDTFYSAEEAAASATYTPFGHFDSKLLKCSGVTAVSSKNVSDGTKTLVLAENNFTYDDKSVDVTFSVTNGSFKISPKSISNFSASASSSPEYTGSEITAPIVVKDNGVALNYPADYELSDGDTAKTDIGTYYVTVKGKGNYKDTISSVAWEIVKAKLVISIKGKSSSTTYNASPQYIEGFTPALVEGNLTVYGNGSLVKTTSDDLTKVGGTNADTYTKSLYASYFMFDNTNVEATFVESMDVSLKNTYNDSQDGWFVNVVNSILGVEQAYGEDTLIATSEYVIKPKEVVVNAVATKPFDESKLQVQISSGTTGNTSGIQGEDSAGGYVETTNTKVDVYSGDKISINLSVNGKKVERAASTDSLLLSDDETEQNTNYFLSDKSTLTITEAEIVTITGNTTTADYDGNAHSFTEKTYSVSAKFDGYNPDYLTITGETTITDKTDAGTYNTSIAATYYDPVQKKSVDVNIAKQAQLVINKRNLSNVSMSISKDYEYTGSEIVPAESDISIKDSTYESALQRSDYTIEYPDDAVDVNTPSSPYIVSIVPTDTSNYYGEQTCGYDIVAAKRIVKVVGASDTATYDGSEHSVTGYDIVETDLDGKEPTYKLVDSDSITPAKSTFSLSQTDAGTYTLDLSGQTWAYNGDNASNITISQWATENGSLTISSLGIKEVTVDQDSFVYNGAEQGPAITSITGTDENDIPEDSYVVTGNKQKNANIGTNTYTLKVEGINNYAGATYEVEWTISPNSRTVTVTGTKSSRGYDGTAAVAEGWQADETIPEGESAIVDKSLISTTSEAHAEQTEPGKQAMGLEDTFTYTEVDTNNVEVTFEYDDGYAEVTKQDMSKITITGDNSFIYNGSSQAPTCKLTNNGIELTADEDYTSKLFVWDSTNSKWVEATQSVNVGKYKFDFTGKGSKYDENTVKSFEFTIQTANISVKVSGKKDTATYNGNEQSSTFAISADTVSETTSTGLLTLSKISYTTATELVASGTDKNTYSSSMVATHFVNSDDETGNTKTTFTINSQQQLTINAKLVSNILDTDFDITNPKYSGSSCSPTVAITDSQVGTSGIKLVENTDYKVVVSSQTAVGTYSLKVVGQNNYGGEVTKSWQIEAVTLKVNISGESSTVDYDGEEKSIKDFTYEIVDATNSEKALFSAKNITYSGGSLEIKQTDVNYDEDGKIVPYTLEIDESKLGYSDTSITVEYNVLSDVSLLINPVAIDSPNLTIEYNNDLIYNGQNQIPTTDNITIKNKKGNTIPISGQISISGNQQKNVSTGDPYSVTLTANEKSNFKDSTDLEWNIIPREVVYKLTDNMGYSGSNYVKEFEFVNDPSEEKTPVGSEKITGTLTSSDSARKTYTLKTGKTYTDTLVPSKVTYTDGAIKTNYNLKYDCVVTIGVSTLDTWVQDDLSFVYDKTSHSPLSGGTSALTLYTDTSKATKLVYGTDFEFDGTPLSQTNKGEYSVKVVGKGDFGGTKSFTWSITAREVTITVDRTSTKAISYGDSTYYVENKGYVIPLADTEFEQASAGGTRGIISGDKVTANLYSSITSANPKGIDIGTYTPTSSDYKIYCTDIASTNSATQIQNYNFVFSDDSKLEIAKRDVYVKPSISVDYNGAVVKYEFDSSSTTKNAGITGMAFTEKISGSFTTSGADAGEYLYGATTNKLEVSTITYEYGAKEANYSIHFDDAKITITPAKLKVSLTASAATTKAYDGSYLKYDIQADDIEGLVSGEELTGTLTTSKDGTTDNGVDVGVYKSVNPKSNFKLHPSGLSAAGETKASNYDLANVTYDCSLEITKYSMQKEDKTAGTKGIRVEYTNSFTYTGAAQNPKTGTDFKVYDTRISDSTPLATSAYLVNSDDKINANVDGATYTFTITGAVGSNYNNDTLLSYTWTIDPLEVEVKPNLTTEQATKQYDNSAFSYTLVAGDVVKKSTTVVAPETFTGTIITDGVDAGTYASSASHIIEKSGYEIAVTSGQKLLTNYSLSINTTFTISPKDVVVKNVGSQSSTFNGQNAEFTYSSDEIVAKESNAPGMVGTQNITGKLQTNTASKGTYVYKKSTSDTMTETLEPTGDVGTNVDNYNISYDVSFEIKSQELSEDNGARIEYVESCEYLGTETRPDIYDTNFDVYVGDTKLVQGEATSKTADYYVSGTKQIKANTTATPTYTFEICGINNYSKADGTASTISKTWKITQKKVTISAGNNKGVGTSSQYSGSTFEYTLTSGDVDGVVSTEKISGTLTTSGKNVGDYKFGTSGNTITPSINVTDTEGKAQSHITKDNYSISYDDSVVLKIVKREAKINGTRSKEYDGTGFTDELLTSVPGAGKTSDFADVIAGEKFTVSASTNSSNAGEYSAGAGLTLANVQADATTGASTDNYTFKNEVVFTINKAEIKDNEDFSIVYDNALEYNGDAQRPNVYIVDNRIGEGIVIDSNDYVVDGVKYTDASTDDHTFTIKSTDKSKNYTLTTPIDRTWKLNKRKVKLINSVPEKDYDGKAFKYSYSSKQGDIENGDVVNKATGKLEIISGTLTTKGSDAAVYEIGDITHDGPYFDQSTGAKQSNYEIDYYINLQINKISIASSDVNITCASMPYNGTIQTPQEDDVVVTAFGNTLKKFDPNTGDGDYSIESIGSAKNVSDGAQRIVIIGHNNFIEDSVNDRGAWSVTPIDAAVILDAQKAEDGTPLVAEFGPDNIFDPNDLTKPGLLGTESVTGKFQSEGSASGKYIYDTLTPIPQPDKKAVMVGEPVPGADTDIQNYKFFYKVNLEINGDLSKGSVVLGDVLVYDPDDPKTLTQNVTSVTVDGNVLTEGTDYVVKNNTATKPGVYKLTIEPATGSSYSGSLEITYVVVGPEMSDVKLIGDIVIDGKSDANSPEISLSSKPGYLLADICSADELRYVADNLTSLHIYLSISDISSSISASSKNLLDAQVAKVENRNTLQYDDISLYKSTTDLTTKESTVDQIHETKNPVDVTLGLLDSMKPTADIKSREFGIIRNHESVVDELETQFDEKEYSLTFETSKFSDYSLTKIDTYVDKPQPSPSDPSISGATGDNMFISVMFFGFVSMLMMAIGIYALRRKRN